MSMSPVQSLPAQHKPTTLPTKPAAAGRYFYSIAAIVLFVLMFLGFQQFYLHGKAFPNRPLAPPVRGLLIMHGVAMTLWMVLFLVQPLLVAGGNKRMHMTVGKIGAVLALCIIGLGMYTAIQSAKFTPPEARIWGLPGKNFMAVPVISIIVFAVYVGLGVLTRKNPAIHRPMMFMAVMSTMSAPIARIEYLSSMYHLTIWEHLFGPFFMTLVIGAILFAIKTIMTRSFDRWFAISFAALVALNWFNWAVAPTDVWLTIATALTR
jgi:hypothetical protein